MSTITTTVSSIPLLRHRDTVVDPATQDDFVVKYEATNDHLSNTLVTELNTLSGEVNVVAGEINANATAAALSESNAALSETAAAASASSNNYQGNWSAGTYTLGEVVSHDGAYWIVNVASTTQEPSASATEWTLRNYYDYQLPTINPTLNLDFANTANSDGTIDLDPRVTFERATTATTTDSRGRVVDIASGEPRVLYEDGVCKGLLIEEARTNLLSYSEDFTHSDWTKGGSGTGLTPSILSSTEIAPDGSYTATRIKFDLNGGTTPSDISGIIQNQVTAATQPQIQYIWIKSGDGGSYTVRCDFNGYPADLAPYNTTLITVTNEWQQFIVGLTSAVDTQRAFALRLRGTQGTSDTADVIIWGAQREQNATFPTSYIPSRPTFTSRASTGTYYDSNGVLQTAGHGQARMNYNPADLTAPARLLVEEQRTNIVPYSENLSTTGGSGVMVYDASVTNPAGESGAYYNTVNENVFTFDGGNSTEIVVSFYTKKRDQDFTAIQIYQSVGTPNTTVARDTKNFYHDGSTAETSNVTNIRTIALPNGWYHISFKITSINSETFASTARFDIEPQANNYIWGLQIETGVDYPTSYIKTEASPVTRSADVTTSSATTRSADVAYIDDSSGNWYNTTEGTLLDKTHFTSTDTTVINAEDATGLIPNSILDIDGLVVNGEIQYITYYPKLLSASEITALETE